MIEEPSRAVVSGFLAVSCYHPYLIADSSLILWVMSRKRVTALRQSGASIPACYGSGIGFSHSRALQSTMLTAKDKSEQDSRPRMLSGLEVYPP